VAHRLIDDAKRLADRYCVKPSERGFSVWRFWPWDNDPCGWRVIVADLRSRQDAETHVLKRLGLTDEPTPQPLLPKPTVIWDFYS
jgi:hypothetical protein